MGEKEDAYENYYRGFECKWFQTARQTLHDRLAGEEGDERRDSEPEQSLNQKKEKAPKPKSLDPVFHG